MSNPPGVSISGAIDSNTVMGRQMSARVTEALSALDFGANDGVSDFAPAINLAMAAASARGGGKVVIPNLGLTYNLGSPIILLSGVELEGLGNPTLKLLANANCSVLEGLNFQTLSGTNSGAAGISSFSVAGLMLDGNRANQTLANVAAKAGHGIAFVGRDFYLNRLKIQNCLRAGLWDEYASGATSGTSPYNGHIAELTTDTTGEDGWHQAVSDTHATDINVRAAGLNSDNTFYGVNVVSGGSVRLTGLNVWSTGVAASALPKASLFVASGADGTTVDGFHLEMGRTADLLVQGNNVNLFSGNIYNNGAGAVTLVQWDGNSGHLDAQIYPGASGSTAVKGIVLGETGYAPAGNQFRLSIYNTVTAALDYGTSGGNNDIILANNLPSGAPLTVGTRGTGDRVTSVASGGGGDTRWGGSGTSSVQFGRGAAATGADAVAIGNGSTSSNGVALGNTNTTANYDQLATGGHSGNLALWGARTHASGYMATNGDNQIVDLTWIGKLTGTAAQEIFLDGSSQEAVVPFSTQWAFSLVLTCRTNAGVPTLTRRWTGTVYRGATGAPAFMGTPTTSDDFTAAAGWSATLSVNTVALTLTVTGAAASSCGANARMQHVNA